MNKQVHNKEEKDYTDEVKLSEWRQIKNAWSNGEKGLVITFFIANILIALFGAVVGFLGGYIIANKQTPSYQTSIGTPVTATSTSPTSPCPKNAFIEGGMKDTVTGLTVNSTSPCFLTAVRASTTTVVNVASTTENLGIPLK
jgi:hypothetical protein